MAYRVRNVSTDDILMTWGGATAPKKINIPGVGDVHCVAPGWTDGGYVFESYTPDPAPEPALADLKTQLRAAIDSDAESIRLMYITPGDGQALTYREKLDQAEQVIADGQAAADAMTEAERLAAYPTLSASVGIEAPTLWGCANVVWAMYQAWLQLSFSIESARLAGKKAVADAGTNDAARAAYAAIAWPNQ